MSNALHDYASLFERYAASNGGTGVYLAGEDCLSLANEMRMDADAIDAENAKLRKLVQILVHCMQDVDNCDTCQVNGNPFDVSADGYWSACDELHRLLDEAGVMDA